MKSKKWIPALLILCALAVTATACESTDVEDTLPPTLLTELTVEAGAQMPEAALFQSDSTLPAPQVLTTLTSQQLCTPGSYPITLLYEEREFSATVHVVDTTPPLATLRELSSLGPMPEAQEYLVEVQDVTEVTVAYQSLPDMTLQGSQQVFLVVTDSSGNETVLQTTLTLDLDVTAPEISGVQDILVYQGSTVAYRSGITVTDDRDAMPALSIDASGVDLSQPGVYTVVYTAMDTAGNTARQEATVTVKEKKPGYVELEVIYAEVDKLLEKLITEDMTPREQAWAIFKWIRNNCMYDNHAETDDVHQAAYLMLTRYQGDCFYHFALSKLMLDRVGIPNLDVVKVKNYPSDSDHYWSMVSVDGGQTWYHFDTTPREQEGFFLVTDAYLDAFSRQHQNCFNRDKSLYPPTPDD